MGVVVEHSMYRLAEFAVGMLGILAITVLLIGYVEWLRDLVQLVHSVVSNSTRFVEWVCGSYCLSGP